MVFVFFFVICFCTDFRFFVLSFFVVDGRFGGGGGGSRCIALPFALYIPSLAYIFFCLWKSPATTKEDNTKKQKSVQKQTTKKKTKTKTKKTKMKKTDKIALPTPKLHHANGNTIVTHGNYTPKRPYLYYPPL